MRTALVLSALLVAGCASEPEPAVPEPAEARPAPFYGNDPLSRIEGAWRSVDDDLVVTFGDGTALREYAGEPVGMGAFEVVDGCDGVARGAFSIAVLEDGEAVCYHVLEAGGETLSYVGGATADTLTFVRDD